MFMIKKVKILLSDYSSHILIVVIALTVIVSVLYFSKAVPWDLLKNYFHRPITEMSVGEFVAWIWFIAAVFSKDKRS
jgi:hypothetical protein